MKLFTRMFLVSFIVLGSFIRAQVTVGDYRSNSAAGNWDVLATWETCTSLSPETWVAATVKPGAANNVYIQSGHSITLTQDESCYNLHMCNNTTSSTSGTVRGKLYMVTFTLNLYGKIRSYYGAVGALPGTSVTAVTNQPFFCTAGSTGKIKVVGDTRVLTAPDEWASITNSPGSSNCNFEFALNPGKSVTLSTNFKAGSFTITSGTVIANTLAADVATAGTGDITIAAGAKLICNASGNAFQMSSSKLAGTLTVNGTLVFTTSTAKISMTNVIFNGTVQYDTLGAQMLAVAVNSGGVPNTYNNLIISGSGVKTLSSNITVNGTLSLQGTTSLALGTNALTYGSSASLEYAGSAAQTTSDAEFPSAGIKNLTVSNAAGVNLHAARTIEGAVNITSGNLVTGLNLLTLGGAGTLTEAAGSGVLGIIQTTRTVSKSVKETFGGMGFELTANNAAPGATIVRRTTGTPLTVLGLLTVKRFFDISPALNSGLGASVTVKYDHTDLGAIDEKTLGVFNSTDQGANWNVVAGTLDSVANTCSASGINSLSKLTLGNKNSQIPVELTSFTATVGKNNIVLNWITATETNNSGYDIERKFASDNWEKIGFVQGKGNSTSFTGYTFTDKNVQANGTYLYRLKQIDYNGQFEYLNAVSAEVNTIVNKFSLFPNYPNPFNPCTSIKYQTASAGNVTLMIYDITGQLVKLLKNCTEPAGNYSVDWNGTDDGGNMVPSGIYFARLSSGAGSSVVKMTLLK